MKTFMEPRSKEVSALVDALLSNQTKTEAYAFLRDLLTFEELVEFANRWKVANMLTGKIPYSKIEKETGMSSTTIARISKWLKNGMGGYQKTIERLNDIKTQTAHRTTS